MLAGLRYQRAQSARTIGTQSEGLIGREAPQRTSHRWRQAPSGLSLSALRPPMKSAPAKEDLRGAYGPDGGLLLLVRDFVEDGLKPLALLIVEKH